MTLPTEKYLKNITQASFWPLHLTGWLMFVVVHYIQVELMLEPGKVHALLLILFYTSVLVFLTIQRYFYKCLPFRSYSMLKIILIIIATAVCLSFLRYMTVNLIMAFIDGRGLLFLNKLKFRDVVWSTFYNSMIFIGWSGLYFGTKFWMEWNEQKAQTQQAYALAQKAQLRMLRYQLNPHFLFNSLNSIRALISENKKNAKGMITELAEFLRYSLLSENIMEVPLNQEILAIRHYYAIEKRRYESKLEIDFEIDARAADFPIISFLIHPLVENAIKYGMRTSSIPLRVTVRAVLIGDTLKVEVGNSGKWIEPPTDDNHKEDGTGTGLKNVRHRLQSAYPERHNFCIEHSDHDVCVRFEIFQKGDL
ncbi:MAG: histidine kinase [Candidatus Neomarinimicrobiota bacterium]